MSLSHHPLCMTLWSGQSDHCECPEVNTCRACSDVCTDCTWEQETCECYVHEDPPPADVTGPTDPRSGGAAQTPPLDRAGG